MLSLNIWHLYKKIRPFVQKNPTDTRIMKLQRIFLSLLVLAAAVLAGCSSDEYVKSPVDDLIRDMDKEKDFTILLYDMDVEGSMFKTYKHRYKIITNENDSIPKEKLSSWYEVDEQFFDMHVNDMGMEIAAKVDGTVTKETAPPGFSNYVGNDRYGQWKSDASGNSFWAFYGQYAFMSNMMGMMSAPLYRQSYYDYQSNYRGVRPYYGTGTHTYGTFSQASKTTNPSFHQRLSSNSSFKNRVSSSVSRSSDARATRSGSRYNSSSSGSRSRSSSGGGK
jgi:hypothetical protein